MKLTRAFLPPLLALILSGIAMPVAAVDTASLADLRGAQSLVYPAIRQFHMETLLSGDPLRRADLKQVIERAARHLDALPGETGNDAFDAAVRNSREHWKAFSKLALANNILRDGYTDENLVGDLNRKAGELVATLNATLAAHPLNARKPRAAEALAINVLLQHTISAYLERSAQMSPDIGAAIPFDIEKAVTEIDQRLAALSEQIKSESAAIVPMRTASSKWKFIRGSLISYNEKSVPYIVDRYAENIGAALSGIVDALENPPADNPGPDFSMPGAPIDAP